jgi:hypothetical protein
VKSLFNSKFWIKVRHWEYWPWYFVYIPIFTYWLWCGIKARAIFYLSAANPGFEYGGIIGASKKAILDKFPSKLVPRSILVERSAYGDIILSKMAESSLGFPVVMKPDVGERGFNVELVKNGEELTQYLADSSGRLIIQEYVDLPLEAGVFYYRFPGEDKGTVSSIVIKGLLKVVGDGHSTIRELMQKIDRARLQIRRLEEADSVDLQSVPKLNQEVLLEPIGNHVRGTTFLDGCYLIDDKLIETFDSISKNIDGFYYGRFDLRCKDEKALKNGDFKVLELNGSASEPAHIYSPGFPLIEGYRILFIHWQVLYKISVMNHKQGVPYMSFRTGLNALKKSRFAKQ